MASSAKPDGMAVLNRAHPIAQGLRIYFPFVEGAGCRTVEMAGNQNPSQHVAQNIWELGPPGWAYSPAAHTGALGYRYEYRTPGLRDPMIRATIGMLIKVQAGGSTGNAEARPFAFTRVSSEADVNKHLRVDFIANTNYVRLNTGQLTAGEIRSIFITGASGSFPNVLTGIWGTGALTTPTYFDRGSASGTFSQQQIATTYITGQDASGSAKGACCVWWMGVWNRVLGADEMQTLHRNPWVLLTKPHLLPEYLFDVGGWASRVQHGGHPASRVVA